MSELQVKTAESRFPVLDVALTGVFTALVFVMTMFVQVQIIPAQGGLVHLGNVPLFFAAAFFGKKVGALLRRSGNGVVRSGDTMADLCTDFSDCGRPDGIGLWNDRK